MTQDVVIVFISAILATVLLLAGIAWFLARSRRPPRAPSVSKTRPVDAPTVDVPPRSPRGPLQAVRDMIDASIGMYLFRRLLGRPTTLRSKESPIPLTFPEEDVVAGRIGTVTPGAPAVKRPTRIVVVGAAAVPAAVGADARSSSPGPDRRRFYRDTLLAVAGVAAVLVLAVVVLPSLGKGDGQVLSATGTPDRSGGAIITATPPETPALTPTPTPTPTPALTPTPTPTPAPTPEPIPTPTPEPIPTPTPMPPPRVPPTPTRAPTPSLTPAPTPSLTPAP